MIQPPLTVDFFYETLQKAYKNGIAVVLKPADTKGPSGTFTEFPAPTLTLCGYPHHELMNEFVHLSCHMDQYLENTYTWEIGSIALAMIDKWMVEKTPTINSTEAFKHAMWLDCDCNKRALDVIKLYELPIDRVTYIKKANAALMAYPFCMEYRIMVKDPQNSQDLVEQMPGDKILNFLEIRELYLKQVIIAKIMEWHRTRISV